MPCREGIDPADFSSGSLDPADDPDPLTTELSILDATAVRDPDGTAWVRFRVAVSTINFQDACTVRFDTSNGSASAGTDYVGQTNQTLTIPAGEGEGEIEVQVVLGNQTATKTFTGTLSVPSFCTILDASAVGTIRFSDLQDDSPPPPPDPDENATAYTGWPRPGVTYAQFAQCGYQSACTGFSGAALMSALHRRRHGLDARFDAKKLFEDAGGKVCGGPECNQASCNCSSCPPFSMIKVLKHMRDTGVKMIDSNTTVTGGVNYRCTTRSYLTQMYKIAGYYDLGDNSKPMSVILKRIKKAIVANGVCYIGSIFYSEWNKCRSIDNYVLRDQGNATSAIEHAWILTGWDDNKAGGAFEIQSSHGCDWGVNGRGWIPYSYLRPGTNGGSGPRYSYREVRWGGPA